MAVIQKVRLNVNGCEYPSINSTSGDGFTKRLMLGDNVSNFPLSTSSTYCLGNLCVLNQGQIVKLVPAFHSTYTTCSCYKADKCAGVQCNTTCVTVKICSLDWQSECYINLYCNTKLCVYSNIGGWKYLGALTSTVSCISSTFMFINTCYNAYHCTTIYAFYQPPSASYCNNQIIGRICSYMKTCNNNYSCVTTGSCWCCYSSDMWY